MNSRNEPITGKSLEFLRSSLRCDECDGKPDFIYFRSDDGRILSSICTECRSAFECAIKSIGRSFCTDPDCKDCPSVDL
jgi:hypothetical protein